MLNQSKLRLQSKKLTNRQTRVLLIRTLLKYAVLKRRKWNQSQVKRTYLKIKMRQEINPLLIVTASPLKNLCKKTKELLKNWKRKMEKL